MGVSLINISEKETWFLFPCNSTKVNVCILSMVLSNVIFPPLNYASYIQALLPQYEELISREASVKCPATYAAKASLTCTRTVHGTGHQWQVGARVHMHCKPDLCQVDSVRTLDWTRGRIINTGRSAQSCHNFYLTTNRNLTKKKIKSNQIQIYEQMRNLICSQ